MRILLIIPKVIMWLAWLVFLSSFFLPAYDGLERPGAEAGTTMLGWEAMLDSIVLLAAKFWVVLFEPRFLVFFLAPIGNVIVLLTPFCTQIHPEESWPLAVPLVATSAMMWILPAEMYQHTLCGFWAWNLSSLTMAIAVAINTFVLLLFDSA